MKCGSIIDLGEEYLFNLEKIDDNEVLDCEVSFKGICKNCKKKRMLIMELKGSKTEQNLMAAFAGESQARNKYTYFASKAKKRWL